MRTRDQRRPLLPVGWPDRRSDVAIKSEALQPWQHQTVSPLIESKPRSVKFSLLFGSSARLCPQLWLFAVLCTYRWLHYRNTLTFNDLRTRQFSLRHWKVKTATRRPSRVSPLSLEFNLAEQRAPPRASLQKRKKKKEKPKIIPRCWQRASIAPSLPRSSKIF